MFVIAYPVNDPKIFEEPSEVKSKDEALTTARISLNLIIDCNRKKIYLQSPHAKDW